MRSTRATDRGTNKRPSTGHGDARDLPKVPLARSRRSERMPGPGLRRRERRFESCRGHSARPAVCLSNPPVHRAHGLPSRGSSTMPSRVISTSRTYSSRPRPSLSQRAAPRRARLDRDPRACRGGLGAQMPLDARARRGARGRGDRSSAGVAHVSPPTPGSALASDTLAPCDR